jgi:cytochrome P450
MTSDVREERPAILLPEAESVAYALLRTTEGRRNPYPLYHRLRELAPVHRSDTARGWLITRYDDCKAILRDPRMEKRYDEALDARSSHWRERPALRWAGRTLLNLDGANHARLRRHVFRSFTRGSVERLRPTVQSLTDELLSELAGSGGGELMEQVAFRLPVAVIGELLGVPGPDLNAFRERTLALTAAFELGVSREQLDAADVAAEVSIDYFTGLIDAKRRAPADDLLSRLVSDADAGDGLTDQEINDLAMLLFFAGFETTTNMIGSGVLALLDQPEQLTLLRDLPALWETFPTELLRHSGTVQLVSRFTVEDVVVGGCLIPAGEAVYPLIGAANRDPDRYLDPDDLDVTRQHIHPLAFGGGVHHCLGAALAEIEIEIVFRTLVDRFDVADMADLRPAHRDRLVIRAPSEVPVLLTTRSSAERPVQLPARPADDDAQWRTEYRRHSEATADSLHHDLLAARIAVLARIPMFGGCRPEDLELLTNSAYPISFDPGDDLCVQGADSPDCYIIVEGEARVVIGGSEVAIVTADDVVGEKGPIEDRPRAAAVTAISQMITFAISRDRLHQVMAANPGAAEQMRRALAARYGG